MVDPFDKVLGAPLGATTALRQLRISWHTHSNIFSRYSSTIISFSFTL